MVNHRETLSPAVVPRCIHTGIGINERRDMMKIFKRTLMLVILVTWLTPMMSLAAEKVVWKFAYTQPANSPGAKQIREMFDEIRTLSKGRLDIQWMDAVAAGFNPADGLRIIKQKVAEATVFNRAYLGRDEPLLKALVPHGALLRQEENQKLIAPQENIVEEILARKWNVAVMSHFISPDVVDLVLMSRSPVNSLKDMQKLKIRHWEAMAVKAFGKVGISVQTMPMSEVFIALKTGVIDGTVMARRWGYAMSYHEPAPYSTYLHSFTVGGQIAIIANHDKLNNLPADLRKIVGEVTQKHYNRNMKIWMSRKFEIEFAKKLKDAGGTETQGLSNDEREKLRDAYLTEWGEKSKKMGSEAYKIYGQLSKAIVAGKK